MKRKRTERLKHKKAKRAQFLTEQRKLAKWARAHQAAFDYAVCSKAEGCPWRIEFNSANEACRDTAFKILLTRTDIDIRRVNL